MISRKVVGWDLSDSLEKFSTIRALYKAIINRNPEKGLLIHSNRGVQYDSAVVESFFHTIKLGLIYHSKSKNVIEAEQALFNYIEVYYNRRRKHSTNNQKSPAQFELEWINKREVA